ncbi:MAG: hypothetical protein D3910_22715 [Candidatus Electrothrix sp. ATG2]|nr:hypothetical protein [Candidatus Electrothrix sp. ATG2]
MKQSSDAEIAQQNIKEATAKELEQSINSEKQRLALGKYSASGKWAVIGLIIIAACYFVFKLVSM